MEKIHTFPMRQLDPISPISYKKWKLHQKQIRQMMYMTFTNKVHVRIHYCESAANYLFILLAFFVIVSFIIQLCEMFRPPLLKIPFC